MEFLRIANDNFMEKIYVIARNWKERDGGVINQMTIWIVSVTTLDVQGKKEVKNQDNFKVAKIVTLEVYISSGLT